MNSDKFLTNWMILNSNGDWEREYGIKLFSTSDPGWRIELDIIDTVLENYSNNFSDIKNNLDWMKFEVSNEKLVAECSLQNFEQFICILYEKLILNNLSCKNYIYNSYIKINAVNIEVFYPIEIITENLVDFTIVKFGKVENINDLSFRCISDLEKFVQINNDINEFNFESFFPKSREFYHVEQVQLLNGVFPIIF